jgi:S-DNA-T family DNA segregation ATPase FtsK/SpoIIIE
MKKAKGKKSAKEDEGEEINAGGNFLEKNKAIIAGVFLLFLTVFSFSSLFGMSGSFGDGYFTFMTNTFGVYAYLAPLFFLFLSYILSFKKVFIFHKLNTYLFGILILNVFIFLGFFKIVGRVGNGLANILQNSVGTIPTLFLLAIITVVILLRVFETNFSDFFKDDSTDVPEDVEAEAMPIENKEGIYSKIFSWMPVWNRSKENQVVVNHAEELGLTEEEVIEEEEVVESEDVRDQMYRAVSVNMNKPVKEKPSPRKAAKENLESVNKKDTEEKLRQLNEKYARPPLSMYTEDVGKASAGDNKENARIIKRTLADFGISVEMDEVTVGPTVTRYALKPAQGVKIEKIMNLANNIALELGVPSVSIIRVHERSLIGVEVPNKQKSRLGLSSLFGSSKFAERKDKLTIALGKDIYGEPVYADMTKMPHLLIAGTTGSGKSVLVHGIINSLIYNNSPYDLKFILIDPKKVELALYNNLPHLYTPVIKDPKKAVQTLNWLVQEMDRRYAVLEEFGKQNISGYHASILEKYRRAEKGANIKLPESMPYIVVVIDELADFMMKYPKEMESGIVKLAQMSRAVGIHLILATQRPSTNIITGVIKGNIPSRIALRVASQVDSRVILDAGGAEKLLGIGDLLFVNADGSDMKRIQSPNVTEEEIREVVAYLRARYDDVVTEDLKAKDGAIVGTQSVSGAADVNRYNSDTDFSSEDDKFEDAKSVVIQTGKTSISNLQVRLGTGYARSAKLINMLEQAGVIITTTDNSGKKVKVVAGHGGAKESEKLEAEADKLLEENTGKEEESQEEETGGNKIAVNSGGDSGGFFRF